MSLIPTLITAIVGGIVGLTGLYQALKKDARSARSEDKANTLKEIETAWRMQNEAITRVERELAEVRSRAETNESRIAELESEVTRLRAENDQLRSENKDLRRRLDWQEQDNPEDPGAPHA